MVTSPTNNAISMVAAIIDNVTSILVGISNCVFPVLTLLALRQVIYVTNGGTPLGCHHHQSANS